ncbi:unnamed protein product [Periconia digitata]|uniref:Uncharacterized protein n=1 Tax=Periconia digitata TaxID=1303443 RepID=A0A9W4U6W3_9PLEO|nr:unnamed protein product [Periconia digitata]
MRPAVRCTKRDGRAYKPHHCYTSLTLAGSCGPTRLQEGGQKGVLCVLPNMYSRLQADESAETGAPLCSGCQRTKAIVSAYSVTSKYCMQPGHHIVYGAHDDNRSRKRASGREKQIRQRGPSKARR